MKRKIISTVLILFSAVYVYGSNTEKQKMKEPIPVNDKENEEKKNVHGGAGGFIPSFLRMDLTPVENMIKREARIEGNDLEGRTFNFQDRDFILMGGMGYGGSKNSGRIGGGGWFSHKRYLSDTYTGTIPDSLRTSPEDSTIDSVAQLDVMLGYGGMILEKGQSLGNLNLHVGGLWGGGAIIVMKDLMQSESETAFNHYEHKDENDSLKEFSSRVAVAPMMVFDLHAGLTYSLAPWVHVGTDANVHIFYSSRGFGRGNESFLTYNPGIRVRLLFGNLG